MKRREAIKKGLKFYTTDKPCSRGNFSHRRAHDGTCQCDDCKKVRLEANRKCPKYNTPYTNEKRERYRERYGKRYTERKKRDKKKGVENLSKEYIKNLLINKTDKQIGFKDIPDWLIELKRANLLLKRKIGGYYERTEKP